MQATKPHARLEVTTDAAGIISHAGAELLVELADRLEFKHTLELWTPKPAGHYRTRMRPCCGTWRVMLADGGELGAVVTQLREHSGQVDE